MSACDQLLEYIDGLRIIDTHEHLPLENELSPQADVLSEWLKHYFSCDLVSAGLSDKDLAKAKDPSGDLAKRWKRIEPYWHAAKSTGYGRSLAIAARDLFGIEDINAGTILELNERMRADRARKGHYARVLQDRCRIAVSIKDSFPAGGEDSPDAFVYTIRAENLITPGHYSALRALGEQYDVRVHTLADWEEVARRHIGKHLDGKGRVVCLKLGLAYHRSLRFNKVTRQEAERDFHELFADRNLPAWRPGIKIGQAFQDYMQHAVCRLADERGLTYQIHTGIQEGNGNVIYDSNPTLLTNLFLEYGNVKFDVFHMGYPYVMELGNLAKNFRNVHIDMCWGHIISPEAARRALVEWLDAVPANKISAFGGDYCFVEGVYGHQYLARRNVAASLARKVQDGSFDLDRAKEIAQWLFLDNPVRIFGLQRLLKKGPRAAWVKPEKP